MQLRIGGMVRLKHDSLLDKHIVTGGRVRLRPIEAGESALLQKGTQLKVVDLVDSKNVSTNLGVLHPVVEIDDERPLALVACYDVE